MHDDGGCGIVASCQKTARSQPTREADCGHCTGDGTIRRDHDRGCGM